MASGRSCEEREERDLRLLLLETMNKGWPYLFRSRFAATGGKREEGNGETGLR